jgi:hypothetical protein
MPVDSIIVELGLSICVSASLSVCLQTTNFQETMKILSVEEHSPYQNDDHFNQGTKMQ